MSQWDELVSYYDQRYAVAAGWLLRPDNKIFLGRRDDRQCRFCGRGESAVSFKDDAHALPECIGNKSLFTYYECDDCNHEFGKGCENDFGIWSHPARTMTRVRGKEGVPTIKERSAGGWRIEGNQKELRVSESEVVPYEDDPDNKTLTFKLIRGRYRPAMVTKALVKMALSIMPEEEMSNFQTALSWIRPRSTAVKMIAPTLILHTGIGGPTAPDVISAAILKRRSDDLVMPYAFLVLTYGNEMLQVAIPGSERDRHHYGKQMTISRFPNFRDAADGTPGEATTRLLSFDSDEFVRDEMVKFTFRYENSIARSP